MTTFPTVSRLLPTSLAAPLLALSLLSSGCIADAIDDPEAGSTSGPAPGDATGGPGGPGDSAGPGGSGPLPATSSGGPPPSSSSGLADDGDGPLITTGNDFAIEWDVTVRHTLIDQPPEEGTYYTTTLVDMDTDFQAVVAIPGGGGSTHYAWLEGDVAAGDVTITNGSLESFDVSIEGTLSITETTLGGSGTFHDANTDALMGSWEILSATARD